MAEIINNLGAKMKLGGKIFKSFGLLIAIFSVLVISGCGSDNPNRANPDLDNSVSRILITTDTNSISNDGSETATLSIRALDTNNAAVEGVEINLSATLGALSSAIVITDASGRASVMFDSGSQVKTATAVITASAQKSITETISIEIIGAIATLTADKSFVALNGASTATLTVQIFNNRNEPARNIFEIVLSADSGSINGQRSVMLYTDSQGRAQATYAGGTTAGVDTITLTGPDTKTLPMTVSSEEFTLTDTQGGEFNFSAIDEIILTWKDQSGTGVEDREVLFSCGKCEFEETGNSFITLSTNSDGKITTYIMATSLGADTITAQGVAPNGESISTQFNFISFVDTPDRLILNINPSVISRSQGENRSSATVQATVLDIENRPIQNFNVAFSLISGPGGGEIIEPTIATTNSAGVATSTIYSGTLSSAQDGVTVLGRLINNPEISDTKKLTIGNQAVFISIGEGNTIGGLNIPTQVSTNSEIYALPFSVLVTDTNGNPLPNQLVSLGLYPTQFRTGFNIDRNNIDMYFVIGTYANEDTNRNGILDEGEDASSGIFANGRLDPGAVAALPATVITDENGFAAFSVTYAKAYARWVDVEISASTQVSGTENVSVINVPLTAAIDDEPYLDSPFGQGELVPPTVVQTSPTDNQTNVSRNANIVIFFDRPMDKESISATNLSVVCTTVSDDDPPVTTNTGILISNFVLSNDMGTRFEFTQSILSPLFPADSTCQATLTETVKDLTGLSLAAPYSFNFSIAP